MFLKFLVDEDFVNYKKGSMFIGFPYCTFKCDKENGTQLCQNMPLIHQPNIQCSAEALYDRYVKNEITSAVVLGGLEPLDTFDEVYGLIKFFRDNGCEDDFVIYTGYTEEEVMKNEAWKKLLDFSNIIVKYGRFKPNEKPHLDEVLGVNLASNNQYAKKYN